jgi:hypothetical protein
VKRAIKMLLAYRPAEALLDSVAVVDEDVEVEVEFDACDTEDAVEEGDKAVEDLTVESLEEDEEDVDDEDVEEDTSVELLLLDAALVVVELSPLTTIEV